MSRCFGLMGALLLAMGCVGESPPEGEPGLEPALDAAANAPAEEFSVTAGQERPRFLPDEMRRATRPESFAHDAHGQIDCAVCHEAVPGHGAHASLGCAECHRASALTTVSSLSQGECLACHHGAEQGRTCEYCHETPATYPTSQLFELEVWETPRERGLSFDHGPHLEEACSTCHQAQPTLSPAVSCSNCHEEHHTGDVGCAGCHAVAPEGTHDLDVHLTCSGAGCHREPAVEAISQSRPVCLACHQDQEMHEPEGECVDCHTVRPPEHFWEPSR